ncbi:MAG TPA: branched-chain amino acid ABC transporter substrate-binding protein [Burkholderiales bacterium]|nr:branched-chain amino acid ABC transporter substrate-binding protein [Burkholderiales bacterium]
MPGLRWILFGWCLAVFAFTARAESPEIVRIGFAAPLTGPQAHYGRDSENGARLAIEELNGGDPHIGGRAVRFELVAEDDQASPTTGTIVAQRLVDRDIRGMAGHFNSGVTIPASRIYHDAGIPQLSVSTNVAYTRQGYRTAFRVMAADDRQGAALGRYAVERLGLKRFAVVDDRSAYGQGIADAFAAAVTAAGGQVVRREFAAEKDVDFRALLTTLRGANPEAIFFGGYDVQAGPMARQMRELGMTTLLLGGETLHTAKFIELAGTAAEGHLASTPGAALERRPGGKTFADRYRQRFGQEPGLYAPYVYDSVMTIAAAMQKAGSAAPAKYLPALRADRHPGVTADIAFDADGNLVDAPLSVFRVSGGKWVLQ